MLRKSAALSIAPLLLIAACSEADPVAQPGTGGNGAVPGMGGTATGGFNPGSGGAGSGGIGTGGVGTGGVGTGGSGGIAAGGSGGAASGGAGTGGGMTGGTGGDPGPMTCPYTPPQEPDTYPQNWTSGEAIVFNTNGGWTWYNDERVVIDTEANKLVVSSAASNASNQNASTNIDVVIHDLATGMNDKKSVGSLSYSDDHNNGGIVVKAPGKYFVAWTHHNQDCVTHFSNYDGSWAAEKTFNWSSHGCPPNNVTYNNVWKLSAENGRIYNFIRSVETSPNFLYSEDDGATWTYGGRLTSSPQVGYNAGYYKYWGNGDDRIDFFATESHPRDSDTSLYHGYVKGEKSYDSTDKEVDGTLFDGNAPEIKEFTRVFAAGSMLDGVTLHNLWNFDVARYADGTIGVLWMGREVQCANKDNCDPKHHVAYSRFDGTTWKSTRLVKGGRTLYRDHSDWWEEDYLGGAALDPDDPHVIYVSTNIDPRDDTTDHTLNEIWKGVTCDDGATFTWTPMTMNSQSENLRPVVPRWDTKNTALVWFRGNYQTAQKYSAEVVGILERE
jgi:hypothetical protein